MAQSNRKSLDTDLHDTVLRGRKFMKNIFRVGLIGGAAWVAIESARAISIF